MDYPKEMPKAYDPKLSEQRTYEIWVEGGYFTPVPNRDKKPFVIIMPPPNVTGELHMGHALTVALEDLMARWHRMKGEPTLYLPGTDHAGIATQVVVERMLAKDGLTRHDLGRQDFVERVWEWVDQYGGRIYEQTKRLGASCDWTRKAFTLDEGPSRAVRTTFVNLYDKGLIFRGERINNWCSRCATALSDLEVSHREENGFLYHIEYPLEDGSGAVTISTTRPETLLGDTAVAVHPDDERYSALVGKTLILPVVNRAIPVVSDDTVDPEFGTGALKVTPGHDHNDFYLGERHMLPVVTVLNQDGTLNNNAGEYEGVDWSDARDIILERLDSERKLKLVEPHIHSVGHCQRCDTVLEPLVSKQWYMRMESLSAPAVRAVEDGRIKIIPEHFRKVYFNWMNSIRDWPISRQLWWGHRIPAWYCKGCDGVMVELEEPTKCVECGSGELGQDPDVLDTWFSSALWPHSTLGWPYQTGDLEYYYPTSVLETGHDILFFWVARMIMMGLENTNEIPFDTVYLHGLVRDPEGVKMSKTKGNVMDPLDLIDLYGADALRFALTSGNTPGNDMRLNEQKMEASRNFANKLWNASRFVMNGISGAGGNTDWEWPPVPEHLEDRWIMSRLNRTIELACRSMDGYQLGEAQRAIHDFMWNEYCDWYLEMSKVRIRNGDEVPLDILAFVLERLLRLLHPFMPFITEEVWQRLVPFLPAEPARPEALIVAKYPDPEPALYDDEAEVHVDWVIDLVRSLRNLRAEFRIKPHQPIDALVEASLFNHICESESDVIKVLAGVEVLKVASTPLDLGKDEHVSMVLTNGTVTVPLSGLIDIDNEKARLEDELGQITLNFKRLVGRLEDQNFLSKAPVEVVDRERQRLENVRDRRDRLTETLSRLS